MTLVAPLTIDGKASQGIYFPSEGKGNDDWRLANHNIHLHKKTAFHTEVPLNICLCLKTASTCEPENVFKTPTI
jgi:hypothetical protein